MSTNIASQVSAREMAVAPRNELDRIFRESQPGPIPAGPARGTAMVLPGSLLDRVIHGLIRVFMWKGKIFRPESGDLKNRISILGFPLIRARVYEDQSWFCTGPAIILDYSKTSVVARFIRNEIRMVSPGVYLGQVFWGKRRIALFMLEFPTAAAA